MRMRGIHLLLIFASFFGYLEWGNNHVFLFQAERDLMMKSMTDPASVMHPFTVLPFVGQLILLVAVFQKEPKKTLTVLGISLLGLLLGFMFLIGILSLNEKIFFSTIPFWIFTGLAIRLLRRKNKSKQNL